MNDNYQSRKNCLQWGLRVLPLETYHSMLKKYTVSLSPGAYELIKKAKETKEDGIWWWERLSCEVVKEKIWVNIATGKRMSDWPCDKVGIFPSWAAYEQFREALREATAKRLRNNQHLNLEYRR